MNKFKFAIVLFGLGLCSCYGSRVQGTPKDSPTWYDLIQNRQNAQNRSKVNCHVGDIVYKRFASGPVELHDGFIRFFSEDGKLITFWGKDIKCVIER